MEETEKDDARPKLQIWLLHGKAVERRDHQGIRTCLGGKTQQQFDCNSFPPLKWLQEADKVICIGLWREFWPKYFFRNYPMLLRQHALELWTQDPRLWWQHLSETRDSLFYLWVCKEQSPHRYREFSTPLPWAVVCEDIWWLKHRACS